MRNTYSGFIHHLKENEYFVFGSNTQGRHGKGAALTAKRKFGAIYGQARGYQGQSYAIVTKDLHKLVHPSVSKHSIVNQIEILYLGAIDYPHHKYYVAYSGNPSIINLNGYTPLEMASMFKSLGSIPSNIIFEENFWQLMNSL